MFRHNFLERRADKFLEGSSKLLCLLQEQFACGQVVTQALRSSCGLFVYKVLASSDALFFFQFQQSKKVSFNFRPPPVCYMGLFRGKSIKEASFPSFGFKNPSAVEVDNVRHRSISGLFSEEIEDKTNLPNAGKVDPLHLEARDQAKPLFENLTEESGALSPVSGVRANHFKDVERFGNSHTKFSDGGLRRSHGLQASGGNSSAHNGKNETQRRKSLKKSLSRRIARTENLIDNLSLRTGKLDDAKQTQSCGISPISELSSLSSARSTLGSIPDSKENGIEECMAGPLLSSVLPEIRPHRQDFQTKRHQGILNTAEHDESFEMAYGEDDVFLVEEATRHDFDVSRAEEYQRGSPSVRRMGRENGEPQEFSGPGNDENLVGPKLCKQPNKARRRPPPLMKAMTSQGSEPNSDFPHTSVFGKDGGFTTGGFRITADGMENNVPLVTREDSGLPMDGGLPQSNRNLVAVRALNELRLGVTIGAGAAGRVCLAEHLPSKKTMAIKIVNVYDKQKRTQLLKELQTLATHVSRYLVRFYGAFYDGSGAVHIALEYMDHGCLSSFVEKVGAIPEQIVQMIAADCLGGLRFLHRHHVLHRDFKTANILLSRRLCCAKVSDFGLARDLNPGVSKVDTFVGTVAYMSPERLQGSEYTYASDIWALGVSIAECLLGEYPFGRPQNYFDYLDATTSGNMLEQSGKNGKKFSAEALEFVQMCTFIEPKRRLTANELLEHAWIREAKRDNHLFGAWLDECRIISMRTPGKSKK